MKPVAQQRGIRQVRVSLRQPKNEAAEVLHPLDALSQKEPHGMKDSCLALRQQLFLYRTPHRQALPDWTGLNTFYHEPGAFDSISSPSEWRARAREVMAQSIQSEFDAMRWPMTLSMTKSMASSGRRRAPRAGRVSGNSTSDTAAQQSAASHGDIWKPSWPCLGIRSGIRSSTADLLHPSHLLSSAAA